MVAKSLLLKGGAGLATAAAGGTGIYYGVDHYLNQLTKFDQGLIDYLEDGGKIQFAVTGEGDSALANDFPNFTGSSTTVTATIKVTIGTGSSGTNGTLTDKGGAKSSDKGHKDSLRKLNGGGSGADWTWICEIKFNKESGAEGDLVNKDKLVKEQSEKGFFNRLKENNESDAKKDKELKVKFIRDCAKARNKEKNRAINGLNSLVTGNGVITEENKIKSTKEFTLRAGNTQKNGEEANKLYPVEKWEFNDWFSIK